MSTRLTQLGTPMVESQTLKLVMVASTITEQISHYLSHSLQSMGYVGASTSVLQFLSTLDCGINYGSEIARSLKVSRQRVAKTVKQLSALGYLEQIEGQGKQKQIVFTQQGERLMADSRKLLAQLDSKFANSGGENAWPLVIEQLNQLSNIMTEISE